MRRHGHPSLRDHCPGNNNRPLLSYVILVAIIPFALAVLRVIAPINGVVAFLGPGQVGYAQSSWRDVMVRVMSRYFRRVAQGHLDRRRRGSSGVCLEGRRPQCPIRFA